MSTTDTLERLYRVIEDHRDGDPKQSYVAKRMRQGTAKIAKKLGEEAVETVIAAMENDKKEIINESADMLFHWLLLMVDQGVSIDDVMEEMTRREGVSGLTEKKNRKEAK